MTKRLLFEIHGWVGINLCILFFVVCFTGTLATLSHEMDWLFNSEIRATPSTEKVSKNIAVKNLIKAYPNGKILYWPASPEPYLCDIVHVELNNKRGYIFINPYTGKIQGKANITFQRFLRDFHYFLFMPFYQFGYFVVLIFSIILLIATATALVFYKKWWRKLFELKINKGRLVFFRSLHRLVGVWSIPFTILFSITGLWYLLERTNIASISDIANMKNPPIEDMGLDSILLQQLSYKIDYDKAIRIAQATIPNLVVKDISLPKGNKDIIQITGLSKTPLVRNRANRVFLHPISYNVIAVQKAEELNTTTWLNDIADPLHFGTWGGLITKIVWFFAGLGISGLILSGLWIALKRKTKSKKPKYKFWKYLNCAMIALIIISMYSMLANQYMAYLQDYVYVSLFLAFFILIGWYVFDYRLNKVLKQE